MTGERENAYKTEGERERERTGGGGKDKETVYNQYNQYGFRKNHSTELAALHLVDDIYYKMDANELPLSVYIDLSKAFDSLDHKILLSKLQFYGITGSTLGLL